MILPLVPSFVQVSANRSALIQGVDTLIAPRALPGAVVASKSAFVVLRTGNIPTVAAGPVGSGWAMVLGHGAFFSSGALTNPSNASFFLNSLAWLSRRSVRGLRIGMLTSDDITGAAKDLGAITVSMKRDEIGVELGSVDVLMMGQGALDGDASAQRAVVSWVKAGHSLIASGPAWGWQQLNPGKSVRTDLSANRMLIPFGLGLSSDIASGEPVASDADDPLLHSDSALESLRKGGLSPSAIIRATGSISRALALTPLDDTGLVAEITHLASAEPAKWPVTGAMPFTRLLAVVKERAWAEARPESVKADPSAELFPGTVSKLANRVSQSAEIDARVPDWHGIGLYAPPGEVIEVDLPKELVRKGIGVRIGSQTDTLWDAAEWHRFPAISRQWALNAEKTKVASPFGGTIYIVVPERAPFSEFTVTVKGAVPAPRYVRGQTTNADWARMLAEPGGPWVELEGHDIILSVPRSAVANLTDPGPLMAYWDEVADQCYGLYAAPRRARPERYCVDRQISAGYMHSGYPIMTHEDVATTFTDVAKLRGPQFPWGFYHELGHNFQEPAWTFDGTGEVTNNLFSLYASQHFNGIDHPGDMRIDKRKARMEKYLAKGAPFAEWKSDPFLALIMYDQLRETFGWQPFTKVFEDYRRLHLRPKDDLVKHDEWMVQMSRATGRNLGPFFTAWGVPTSDSARASIVSLPNWMPPDWPSGI